VTQPSSINAFIEQTFKAVGLRSLFSVLLVPLVLLSFLCAASGLHGQTFNLQTGREPVASLDGFWRFHIGDNPAWADPNFDDSQWPVIRSEEPWSQQGYRSYGGFAWYRFTVAVPEGGRNWSIYLGPMETGYQLFVDGRLTGSFGPILNSRNYAASARVFAISPASGPHTFHIAIRAWHSPVWAGYALGGFYGSSYFGDADLIAQRAATARSLQWNGLVDEYAYAVLSTLVGLVVLVLFFIRREEREYLWFALLLLANAIDIGLRISRVLALIPLPAFDFIDGFMQSAALFVALAFFSVVLRVPRSRTWWFVAALLLINPPAVFLYVFNISSVGIAGLLAALSLLPATVWILITLLKRALQRDRDALILLVPTLLWQGFPFIDSILLITWQFGWQRWKPYWVSPLLTKPFVLMPAPAAGTIFIFALLLFLIRRFSLARQEETRLSSELEIAQQIQQAIVPQGLKDYPHLAITGLHRSCHEVGGDYFDVFSLDDGRIAIFIADVAGKGLGAALVTTMLKGALSAMPRGLQPVKLLEHLDKLLLEGAHVGRYATMFFGLLGPDGVLEFVPAGHPSPLLLRQGKVSELYTGGSFPVGLIPGVSFAADRIQLEPDDTLLLFTDGVTEAEDKEMNLFGAERLVEAFTRYADGSLDALQSGVFRAVESFSGGAKQTDDITLLVVRYRSGRLGHEA
jgi:phosphoserine phosphatase RsbU/P